MSRPDEVTVTGSQQHEAHPEGAHAVRLMDVIDMGERLDTFPGQPERLSRKVVLVFQSGKKNTQGRLHEINAEFTLSLSPKAKLLKFLEQWRGKAYKPGEATDIPLHKLVGTPGFASIENRVSGAGRTYAVISTIMPLPEGMVAPTLPEYERPEFYATRKAGYQAEVAAFKERIGAVQAAAAPVATSFEDVPAGLAEDDGSDLPF